MLICFITKNLNPIVTDLFIRGRELNIRGRELNISLVFITQSYFALSDCIVRTNMKIPNKQELHRTASNNSSDIDF